MQLTSDFLKAKRACADGLAWFAENFGAAAEYQTVLNLLAKEGRVSLADWVLAAVGPVDETIDFPANTTIEGYLFAAGSIRCAASLSVTLGIKAGGGIEAGEGIKAGEDFGIYCGMNACLSMQAKYAVVIAQERPINILLGEYKEST